MIETMGRMAPLDGDLVIHPALPFSFLVAAMAATIAIITGLCGLWRKPSPDLAQKSDSDIAPPQKAAVASDGVETDEVIKELPPPPCMRALTGTTSCNNFTTKSSSMRKISSTLSVKMKKHMRSISVSKILEKKRPKAEDSVWTKTIILGEKCKVSYDKDDGDEDDGGFYNSKLNYNNNNNNTVSAIHQKNPSTTMSISRTNSSRNPDTILDQDKEKGIARKEDEDS